MSTEDENALIKTDELSGLSRSELMKIYGVDPDGVAPGTENIGKDDVKFARLKIMQLQSDSDDESDENRGFGNYYNHITGEHYHKYTKENQTPLQVIIISMVKGRVNFSKAKKLIHRSKDGTNCWNQLPREDGITLCAKCPDALWRGQEPPICLPQFNSAVMVRGRSDSGPLIFTLQKKAYQEGVNINSETKMMGLPFYSFIYNLTTKKIVDENGTYWVPVIKKKGFISPNDVDYITAKAMCEIVKMDDIPVAVDLDNNNSGMSEIPYQ